MTIHTKSTLSIKSLTKLSFILLLLLTTYYSYSQEDSLVSGTYTKIEKRGIRYGVDHIGVYEIGSDTTITYTLLLDTNGQATLLFDTTFGIVNISLCEHRYLGNWKQQGDSLEIVFERSSKTYLISFDGSGKHEEIEILPSAIKEYYYFQFVDTKLIALLPKDETREWIKNQKQ